MAFDSLKKNRFWNRKIHTASVARDVDGDGFITRSDFDLIVQRYKDAGSPAEHIARLQKRFNQLYEIWGLTDGSKTVTVAEFETIFRDGLEKSYSHVNEIFHEMFEQVDINANGEISLKEWLIHNGAIGISSEIAKKSFGAMDVNGDGTVSLQEFVDYHKEFHFSTEDKLKSSLLYGPLL